VSSESTADPKDNDGTDTFSSWLVSDLVPSNSTPPPPGDAFAPGAEAPSVEADDGATTEVDEPSPHPIDARADQGDDEGAGEDDPNLAMTANDAGGDLAGEGEGHDEASSGDLDQLAAAEPDSGLDEFFPTEVVRPPIAAMGGRHSVPTEVPEPPSEPTEMPEPPEALEGDSGESSGAILAALLVPPEARARRARRAKIGAGLLGVLLAILLCALLLPRRDAPPVEVVA
jgi:hypothetical protein